MPVEIEIAGLAEALDRFAQGDVNVGKAMVRATRRGVALLRRKLAVYPGKSTGHIEFKSDKQRRFFWAALREGKIQIPYRRSGTLGRRWSTKVEATTADVVGIVGNLTPYAPFVQGAGKQATIHQGNWQTEQDVARDAANEITGYFADEIAAFL